MIEKRKMRREGEKRTTERRFDLSSEREREMKHIKHDNNKATKRILASRFLLRPFASFFSSYIVLSFPLCILAALWPYPCSSSSFVLSRPRTPFTRFCPLTPPPPLRLQRHYAQRYPRHPAPPRPQSHSCSPRNPHRSSPPASWGHSPWSTP